MKQLGTEVLPEQLANYFIVGEGEGNILIGKIRCGKTYGAKNDLATVFLGKNELKSADYVHCTKGVT